MQVEICLEDVVISYYSETPCGDQSFHALAAVETNGEFLFTEIPVGNYYLMVQITSTSWSNMGAFEVKPGIVTELGQIEFPSN